MCYCGPGVSRPRITQALTQVQEKQTRKLWTPEEDQKLLELYQASTPLQEIYDEFNGSRSESSVLTRLYRYVLNKSNAPAKKVVNYWTSKEHEKLVELYSSGMSLKEIAEQFTGKRSLAAIQSRVAKHIDWRRDTPRRMPRKQSVYQSVSIPKEWSVGKPILKRGLYKNGNLYFSKRLNHNNKISAFRIFKVKCLACNSVVLRISGGNHPVRHCRNCINMEWVRNNLKEYASPGYRRSPKESILYQSDTGLLFKQYRRPGGQWDKKYFVIAEVCPGCKKETLIKSTFELAVKNSKPKANYCKPCAKKRRVEKDQAVFRTANNLVAKRERYDDNPVRHKQMLAAMQTVLPFIPVRRNNIITLPSYATYEIDHRRFSNIVPWIETMHWFELPPNRVEKKDREIHERDIEGLRKATIIFKKDGINTELHIQDVLEARIENLGFINLDLCCTLKDRDLLNLEEVIKFGMPPEGALPVVANFSVSQFWRQKDEYIQIYQVWKAKWESIGYSVPVLKHFPYVNNHVQMFLTAFVIQAPNKEIK